MNPRTHLSTRRTAARLILAASAIAAFAGSASAQVSDKKSLNLDGARRVINASVAEAHKSKAAGVIAVVDDGGNLIAVERLDNTFAAGALISVGKARTAAIFKKPTRFFEDIIKSGRTPMVALNDFTPLQGGVPIMLDGQVVGAVGVSGANSAQQDEEIAIAGANAITENLSQSANTPDMAAKASQSEKAVTFFGHADVDAGFAKGVVLYEDPSVNYAVHASRRTTPGQVEVHTQETDVIHVLQGTAIFVTGGRMVDGKPIAQDEIRGKDIVDGQTRHLVAGDVIIVPAGVPHWFKEVPTELHYYVVKVRDTAKASEPHAAR